MLLLAITDFVEAISHIVYMIRRRVTVTARCGARCCRAHSRPKSEPIFRTAICILDRLKMA